MVALNLLRSYSLLIMANTKQELEEYIPPPVWKFLAPPNRNSMAQSGSLMIFLSPDYEVNEAENRKGSKLHRSP